jgi:hypothetical protein
MNLSSPTYKNNKEKIMREIKTDIEIAAPIEKVWDALMAFDQWGDWNPIVKAASGKAALGETLRFTMTGKDGKSGKDGQAYEPVITEFDAPKQFRFRAKMMANVLFTNDKIFTLESTDTGTKLVHIEAFSGLMVGLFWGKMEGVIPGMLNSMNEALKEKVES